MRRITVFIAKYLYSLIAGIYLYTLGMLYPRNRALLTTIGNHFGFDGILRRLFTFLPVEEMSAVIGKDVAVCIKEPAGQPGNVSILELIVLSQFVKRLGPEKIFEFGTFDGRTTLNMALNCPETARIYTLDLPRSMSQSTALPVYSTEKVFIDKDASGSRFAGKPEEKRIEQVYGDTASFDFGPYYGEIDMVFIDASHTYEYVLNDSRLALKLLRNGRGVILWHDYYVWDGVTRALNELYLAGGEFKNIRHIRETSLAYLILK